MNRDLAKFTLTNQTDENSIPVFNAARVPTRHLVDAEIPFIGLPAYGKESDKVLQSSPPSPESSTDDEKESYARHFSNQKHQLRTEQAKAMAAPDAKIGIVRPRTQNRALSTANAAVEQSNGAEALLALANRGKETNGFLPPRHVTIAIQRHAATSSVTISAVANILRQALKDLKSMDRRQNITRAVQTYEATADRLLHCLRLKCLSAAHTKLAILSLDRCCKQWLVALNNISSQPQEEIVRQREKAQNCRREGQTILRSI
jgi:hypothetical protein